jgi:hypothetical protein
VWLWALALSLCFAAARGDPVPADGKPSLESKVKAAFLFNFGKFIEWPEKAFRDAQDPFVFGIVGEDTFGEALESALKDKTIGGRKTAIKRFKSIEDVEPCQILFVSPSLEDGLAKVIERMRGKPVALVGEREGFAKKGGLFRFFLQDGSVRFEVNPEAARRAGLKVSAKLIQIAVVVKDEEAK